MKNKISGKEFDAPIEKDVRDEIQEEIVSAELSIVKVMFDKDGDIVGRELPYKYINDYINSMFLDEHKSIMFQFASTYVNDMFFTIIPLIIGPKEIALG